MIPFARFVLHEPVRRRDLGFLGALLFGMILFFGDADARFATAPDPVRGNVVAAASAVFWALTVGGLRRLERDGEKEGAAATLVLGNAFAFLFCLPFALPLGAVSTSDGLLIAYLGIFQVGLAYVCLARGVRKVPGLEASFLLLLEPVLNPLWAWVVHGETPGPWTLAGGALVVGAAALKPWLDARSALTELRKRSLQRAS
jgi:drug/metabolite transporter (DMT)-like permease